jgi:antitoxin (DNA-binding transcriptional repressor) of toxin-antitoxin stability system
MDRVSMRNLRAHAATTVRRAEGGERIVVTVDGRAVAQLGPLDPVTAPPTLDDLIARGLVLAPRRHDRPPPGPPIPVWAGARLDRLLGEQRG